MSKMVDYAGRHAKRLVLLVENLNMLFTDMADPDAGWRLRHTLQTEPLIVLIGSATSRFDEIDRSDHALYDIFRVITLPTLDADECHALWSSLSGHPRASQHIRPLQILTGGNPRLISVVAGLERTYSFKELMYNLLDLVDEHTEYFKSHIEALPPQQRRVYLALARLWKPATAREVASHARLDVNRCSAQLKRLVGRGAVSMEDKAKRRRTYQVAERMYNIYYLLRRPGAESHMVDALVRFMGSYYSPDELVLIGVGMAEGLEQDNSRLMRIQSTAFRRLLALPELDNLLVNLLTQDAVIRAFGSAQSPEIVEPMVSALMVKARTMSADERFEDALRCLEDVIRLADDVGGDSLAVARGAATLIKIGLLQKLDRLGEAVETVSANYFGLDQRIDADTADAIVKFASGVDDVTTHPAGIFYRGLTLLIHGNIEGAICDINVALGLLDASTEESDQPLRRIAIVIKGLLVATLGRTIGKTDAARLLVDIADRGKAEFPTYALRALLQYFATIEPEEALALIESTRATVPLLPIAVALQRELGQSPSVAKELHEVSKDVQDTMNRLRKRLDARCN